MYAVWAIAIGIVSARGTALDSLPIALQEIMVPLRFASMTRSRMTRLTKTNLVIQALKSLSDEQITDDVVKKVSNLERDSRGDDNAALRLSSRPLCRDRLFIAQSWPRNKSGVTMRGGLCPIQLSFDDYFPQLLPCVLVLAFKSGFRGGRVERLAGNCHRSFACHSRRGRHTHFGYRSRFRAFA